MYGNVRNHNGIPANYKCVTMQINTFCGIPRTMRTARIQLRIPPNYTGLKMHRFATDDGVGVAIGIIMNGSPRGSDRGEIYWLNPFHQEFLFNESMMEKIKQERSLYGRTMFFPRNSKCDVSPLTELCKDVILPNLGGKLIDDLEIPVTLKQFLKE